MGNELTAEEIAEQYEDYAYTNTASISLGSVSGYISTDYADGGITGYEIMLDQS